MLKLRETLTIAITVQGKGEKIRLVQRKEAQETPRTNAAEETAR
jgi:hypothetical protein